MATLKEWLAFSRCHTASLTIPGTLLGALLADPGQDPWRLWGFAVFALCAHASGFSNNNLFDLPWDRKDPHKQHMPLVRGAIQERDGWAASLFVMFLALALGVVLARGSLVAAAFLFGLAFFGTLYNWVAKESYLGAIWISTSFACLPAFAWTASGGGVAWQGAYVVAFAFILLLAQIVISGHAKELGTAEKGNVLYALGARATPLTDANGDVNVYDYYFPRSVKVFAAFLRRTLVFGGAVVCGVLLGWAWFTAALILALASALAMNFVVSSGQWIRRYKVALMGLSEISAYWLLIFSVSGFLGHAWTLGLILGPLAWYLILNKVMWNRLVAPAV